jgi:2-polyprenyl-3-methyl-5-hydroxy-6-metoxy-1,4-benzoquinol methylase
VTAGCLLCGETSHERLFELARPIVRCRGCGLVYALLEGAAPTHLYDERYYKGLVYADYLADRPAIHKNAARVLAELEALVPGRRLLDVGCAAGFFLEAARWRGWSVEGVEVSAYASEQARRELGLEVRTGSVTDLEEGPARFDAVTLWDVIEHLERPDLALRKVRALLRPGGVLAVSTGDLGSFVARATGRRWRLFADPTHLFFFDARTLGRLLAEAGFRTLRSTRRGKWVSLSMVVKQAPLPLPGGLRRVLERRLTDAYLYANLRDVMTVLAVAGPEDPPRSG